MKRIKIGGTSISDGFHPMKSIKIGGTSISDGFHPMKSIKIGGTSISDGFHPMKSIKIGGTSISDGFHPMKSIKIWILSINNFYVSPSHIIPIRGLSIKVGSFTKGVGCQVSWSIHLKKNRQFGSSQIEGRTCSKRLAAYQSTIFQYPSWIGNYSYI